MKVYSYLYLLCVLFTCSLPKATAQIKIADTIYYNKGWEICEKPIANYYRIGTLVAMDSLWYYTGKFRDYTINDSLNNSLVMEGEYSAKGIKNGPFKFYYPGGKLQATGNYEDGKMIRNWIWYYPNGNAKAQIYFTFNEQNFKFISFKDEEGNNLMENGTGKFIWPTDPFSDDFNYIVKGSFNSGKREGKWKFEQTGGRGDYNFKETYTGEGEFKYGMFYNDTRFSNRTEPYKFRFAPRSILIMETIAYSNFFRTNGDSLSGRALMDYMIYRKPTEIKLKYKDFDSAFAYILRTLESCKGVFDYESKDIDADIEFRLGFKGFPEDITVTGTGINSNEKNFLIFLISKFSHVEMPGTKTIAIEGYHAIYVYDIDVSGYYPEGLRGGVDKELFFSPDTKKKMQAMLDANRKNFKKYFRKMMDH